MRFFTLALFFALATFSAQAETVLICHTQVLPPGSMKPDLEGNLVDAVFDYLFESGAIAFDLGDDPSDQTGDVRRLTGLAAQYGADKVIWFRLTWTASDKDVLKLQSVTFRILNTKGLTLGEGSLDVSVEIPSPEEKGQTQKIHEAFSKALASAWNDSAP